MQHYLPFITTSLKSLHSAELQLNWKSNGGPFFVESRSLALKLATRASFCVVCLTMTLLYCSGNSGLLSLTSMTVTTNVVVPVCGGTPAATYGKKMVNSSPRQYAMKANDGQCLNLVSFSASNLEGSCTDSPGRNASPSQVPPRQCWYSFAAEYTEANWGK